MYRKKNIPYLKKRNLATVIEQRLSVLGFIVIFLFSIISTKLIILQIGNRAEYKEKLAIATTNTISGSSVPRGRIYDRNHHLLVDNIGRKVIYYKKPKGINKQTEIALAYQVSSVLDVPYNNLNITNLKEFWLVNHPKEGDSKITKEEYQKLKMRKVTSLDIYKLKIARVTDLELSIYNDSDKKAAYLYYLMNKGYSYDEKIIKDSNVTDTEYAYISENINNYRGFNTKLEWERKYLYGDTLRGVLGNVSDSKRGIPLELKSDYLKRGYALNDRVGLSYLEYQYEDLLKGEKNLYKVNKDNSYELIKSGMRGHDIVLTIDIKLQQEIENIMIEEMLKTKKEPNTEFYNRSFVIISDPKTGDVLAYAAKQIMWKDGEYRVFDYTPYITTSSITVGSVIKGSSITVGYNTGAINIGTKMQDECIKLKNTPPKCSWKKSLGVVDDIGALRLSSNSYQFKIAMKVASFNYAYNKAFVINNDAFKIYRNTFNEYGLGVKTGIDLPLETTGMKGGSNIPGHLLDFAIGQYDTYTPLQLSQYINTIANNGVRLKLNLLKEVYEPTNTDELGKLEKKIEPTILNKVTTEQKYMDRIRLGFNEVMKGSLGKGYMGNVPNPSGKTGTAESFVDSDNNGKIDKETTSKTFAGYFPADNPIASIVVISPDISHDYNGSSYTSSVNKRITSRASEKAFDILQ